MLPLDLVNVVVAAWLAIGAAGLLVYKSPTTITHVLFPLGALGGLIMAGTAAWSLQQTPDVVILPLGIPDLPFHLRLDALSAFFLMLLGAAVAGVSLFGAGYFRRLEGVALGLLCLQYHVFLAGMTLVMLADDAYLFMVAWETMALSSYFLVTTDHAVPEIRKAGFLYLLLAHIGAVAVLMSFGVLHGGDGDYTFATLRQTALDPFWSSVVFVLALVGFGAKAGWVPLHVWLPEAHPAAPSPVSALMSGVMLKTAVYGLLRVVFDLLGQPLWWWGVVLLSVGLLTALFGAVFAAAQTDMKRLLAYSSIENMGVIAAGLGLALVFSHYGITTLAALAFIAALFHCLNHALFKSLLFCVTGSVLHATGERNLGKLGGLIKFMPWVAGFGLIGALALAGLPPLNGFASEWLLLQAFLLTPGLPQSYLNMFIPVATGVIALTVALSAYVMVKFFGVIFLGQAREAKLRQARDAALIERAGLAWLALACVLLGLAPALIVAPLDTVAAAVLQAQIGAEDLSGGLLFLTPLAPERASYSAPFFFLVIVGVLITSYFFIRHIYHGRSRLDTPWDCGFAPPTPRMQDTAEGFGQPIHQIFEPFFRIRRELPSPFDAAPRYHKTSEDRAWYALYLPIARATEQVTGLVARLHHGRIALYLLYSFVTLLVLLVFAR